MNTLRDIECDNVLPDQGYCTLQRVVVAEYGAIELGYVRATS
jgi:hypothetical protein